MGIYQVYRSKLSTAEEAVKTVKSGDFIQYNSFNGVPPLIDRALAERKEELEGVIINCSLGLYPLHTASSDPSCQHFIYNCWHCSGSDRSLSNYFYVPALYYEMPKTVRSKMRDTVMLQVAPMDRHGNFNFGPNGGHIGELIRNAKKVIVEVNENMPVALGGNDTSVNIAMVDAVVEGDNQPMITIPLPQPDDEDYSIARWVVNEIPDGACVQLGIGTMPNVIGELIADSDLKDLGVHSEMLAEAYLNMYRAGKISGLKKGMDIGRMAYIFSLGTQDMYDFIDNNPLCAMYPVDYINTPSQIAGNRNMIAINNALEIDLFSQINSESIGTRQISGTGGQVDFMLGAYLSEGGKGIICMKSTYTNNKGEVSSRIRGALSKGTIVTVPRTIVHYVATEYGIINLKGKSTWERAEALISIAHPSFREELTKEAQEMHIWTKINKIA